MGFGGGFSFLGGRGGESGGSPAATRAARRSAANLAFFRSRYSLSRRRFFSRLRRSASARDAASKASRSAAAAAFTRRSISSSSSSCGRWHPAYLASRESAQRQLSESPTPCATAEGTRRHLPHPGASQHTHASRAAATPSMEASIGSRECAAHAASISRGAPVTANVGGTGEPEGGGGVVASIASSSSPESESESESESTDGVGAPSRWFAGATSWSRSSLAASCCRRSSRMTESVTALASNDPAPVAAGAGAADIERAAACAAVARVADACTGGAGGGVESRWCDAAAGGGAGGTWMARSGDARNSRAAACAAVASAGCGAGGAASAAVVGGACGSIAEASRGGSAQGWRASSIPRRSPFVVSLGQRRRVPFLAWRARSERPNAIGRVSASDAGIDRAIRRTWRTASIATRSGGRRA